eukprot:m.1656660 g.1656660  ORF g.1656660 m.1656660 type:complete len:50 (+) comp108555_c0_seq1:85-234(+)
MCSRFDLLFCCKLDYFSHLRLSFASSVLSSVQHVFCSEYTMFGSVGFVH